MDTGGCCWQSKPHLLPAESAGMSATGEGKTGLSRSHAHMHRCSRVLTAAGACHPVVAEVHIALKHYPFSRKGKVCWCPFLSGDIFPLLTHAGERDILLKKA